MTLIKHNCSATELKYIKVERKCQKNKKKNSKDEFFKMNNEVFTASPAPVLDVKLKTNWNIVL
jgi:hypothetical protein